MKKIKLTKQDLRSLGIIALLLIWHFGLYFSSNIFVKNPTILNNPIEDKIPNVHFFVIFYLTWYFLLIIVPFILSRHSQKYFKIYCVTYMLCWVFSVAFFILMPTAIQVPKFESNDIFSSLCNMIYSNDNPADGTSIEGYWTISNVFPSGHTLSSTLFIYTVWMSKKVPKKTCWIITILSILVIASTILIKQHVFIDLIGGFILVTIVYFTVKYIFEKREKQKRKVK